ncbi:hypothetical protein HPB50_004735 [Hyalomma asiaticum]|uniref:Uncharacterized protein n=1 Tax=Hyalomma asiaticum TaxID=266040 RepID=A0ACB7S937_HYAAI|nr:hypothetical protein HPB50_004735 [Hyalomma asiaticum]
MDAVHSLSMDDYIRSSFAKTRKNVIHRAKWHRMFDGTSARAITGALEKLKLMLPEQVIVSDVPFPEPSETFAHNLFAARSYVFDVRRAKIARKIPDAESLSLPSLVRNGDVIYVSTNMYALLHHKVHSAVSVDVPMLAMEMASSNVVFPLGTSLVSEDT